MQNFRGKAVIVTGAGGGIGRATAMAFAARGADVACGDIDAGAAAETAALIEATGARSIAMALDVRDISSNTALVDAAENAFGKVDVAFLNAGILQIGRAHV